MLYYTHSFIHQILPEDLGAVDIKLSFIPKWPWPSRSLEPVSIEKEQPNGLC